MKLIVICITNKVTVYGGVQPLCQVVLFVCVPFDKNTLGDVVALRDEDGNVVATYEYDAWGNVTVYDEWGDENTNSSFIGNINPIRYRGYYYDTETGFYYLQTRYYDPTICRFINADDYELISMLAGTYELNLYAYCKNNPIMYIDITGQGEFWDKIYKWGKRTWNSISGFFSDISTDIKNFDINNTSESAVLNSNYFSAYKGTFVLRVPTDASASFGIIFLEMGETSINTVKHEYGHKLQLDNLGVWNYTFQVAIPSLTGNLLDRMGRLPVDYYSQPWEYEADQLGGVYRGVPLVNMTYWDLIKLFF